LTNEFCSKILIVTICTILFIPINQITEINSDITQDYWPTEDWLLSSPEDQSMDSSFLDEMSEFISTDDFNHDSIIVVRNGYIVYEDYFNGLDENSIHHLFSVTKSFVSALVGIAVDQGYIGNVHQTVIEFFPNHTIDNLDEWKEEITIEHLLTMTSGFEWISDFPRFFDMMAAPDQVQFILDLPMEHEPGSHYQYNSGACQLITAILQNTTEQTAIDYAYNELFTPIGIDYAVWNTDKQGINIGGTMLYVTPRDMARLGYLYLNNGTWDGQEILPKKWIINSTTPYIRSSINSADYGYLWWLNRNNEYYYAWGSEGQKIFVIPDYDLVVVFTASSDSAEPYKYILENYVLPACLDYTPKVSVNYSNILSISLIIMIIIVKKYEKRNNIV
jgi:CubicO group peptidase (beta-lactamase class C family)